MTWWSKVFTQCPPYATVFWFWSKIMKTKVVPNFLECFQISWKYEKMVKHIYILRSKKSWTWIEFAQKYKNYCFKSPRKWNKFLDLCLHISLSLKLERRIGASGWWYRWGFISWFSFFEIPSSGAFLASLVIAPRKNIKRWLINKNQKK